MHRPNAQAHCDGAASKPGQPYSTAGRADPCRQIKRGVRCANRDDDGKRHQSEIVRTGHRLSVLAAILSLTRQIYMCSRAVCFALSEKDIGIIAFFQTGSPLEKEQGNDNRWCHNSCFLAKRQPFLILRGAVCRSETVGVREAHRRAGGQLAIGGSGFPRNPLGIGTVETLLRSPSRRHQSKCVLCGATLRKSRL